MPLQRESLQPSSSETSDHCLASELQYTEQAKAKPQQPPKPTETVLSAMFCCVTVIENAGIVIPC